MSRIVNIRGCSGSGKSTLVRAYAASIDDWRPVPHPTRPNGAPWGYRLWARDGFVVGPYVTACGGTDAIKTQDEICDRVREAARGYEGPVFFEGLLVSTLFSRYVALSRELGGITFAFLDTPLGLCLERVRARREWAGNLKPFDPGLTEQKWDLMRVVAKKFAAVGETVVWLDHREPLVGLRAALAEGTH